MPTLASPEQYIYPPRATDAVPRTATDLYADLGWIAQYKYNDTRCLIKVLPGAEAPTFELWNRHGERIRNYTITPELHAQLLDMARTFGLSMNSWSLLDGGLLDSKHPAIKDTIVIWDILVRDGQHLIRTDYYTRYEWLLSRLISSQEKQEPQELASWYYTPTQHTKHEPIDFGYRITDNILMPRNYFPQDWDAMWETVATVNAPFPQPVLEGLFFKALDVPLSMGFREKNNSEWNARSRVETGRHRF